MPSGLPDLRSTRKYQTARGGGSVWEGCKLPGEVLVGADDAHDLRVGVGRVVDDGVCAGRVALSARVAERGLRDGAAGEHHHGGK